MNLRYILCILILCILPVHIHAQSVKYYTADQELSSSLINFVYQDRYGNIWIATEDGLNRYDGAKFTVYKYSAQNHYSLSDNNVHALCEDMQGNLYVGTSKGLQIYDRATDRFTEIPIAVKDGNTVSVRNIMIKNDGTIWLGTAEGIYYINPNEQPLQAKQYKDIKLPDIIIWDIYEDNNKDLWVATESAGLFRIRDNKIIKQYFTDKKTAWNSISSLCQDKNKNLYAGSLGKGLFKYDKAKDAFTPIDYAPNPQLPIMTLYNANQDEIYIGTDGCGVKVLNVHNQEISESDINISTFDFDKLKVHSIIKDRTGNFWLGIYQKGVIMLPTITNEFKYAGSKSKNNNIIGSNCITAVFKDRSGTFWVGADNDGIYKIQNQKLSIHIPNLDTKNLTPSTVFRFFEDSNGCMWIGTYLNGLIQMDTQTNTFKKRTDLTDEQSNTVQKVYCFAEDNQKRLWIGTMGSGLFYLDLTTDKIYNFNSGQGNAKDNILGNKWINTLYINKDNKLFIGTYRGVYCLNLNTLQYEPYSSTRKGLDEVVVFPIYEDEQYNMWIGTSTGLFKTNPNNTEVTVYTEADGLPSNVICGIESDDRQNLWISTNYGISKFDTKKFAFQNYYSNNGLQGNEFSKNAAFKDEKGIIYFGGLNGITYFNPNDITTAKQKVDVMLSGFYISNKPIKKGMKSGSYDIINSALSDAGEINLCHKDNSFTMEFSNMEYNNTEHVNYMYSIDKGDWVKLQSGVNSVSFSDMAPGRYHFKYKARNYDSDSAVKGINIIIHPAWYDSILARIIYLLLAAGIIYYIAHQAKRRYKSHQELMNHIHAEQIKEAKLQFFINISHEIRTPMSLIISPLQKLITTDKDAERQKSYRLIYRNSERILLLINQLMDVRKIDKGQMVMKFAETDLVDFIQSLYNTFEYQAKTKEITFLYHHDMEKLDAWIDPQNFDKVIINLLSNAMKFTPRQGEINIYLNEIPEYAEIIVSDNGATIDESEMQRIFERFYQIQNGQNNSGGTGIGLHLTRSLVELHHGTISVANNEDGKGCRFIVRIPLGTAHLKAEEIAQEKPETEWNEDIELENAAIGIDETEEEEKNKSKSRYRVLIVEDDEEIRKYIVEELSKNYHMQESANGKEALARILTKKPDLVISDVMMPEMDGMTLCKKIKQNVNINHIPVILLTAKAREEDNIEGLDMGADAFIAKPFSIEVLHKTVDNLLKSREVLRNCYTGSQEQEERKPVFELQATDNKLLDRIMNVINRNLSNPDLSVEMIASEVGISRVHLHRKLKELTNQTTRDLIRNVRLKQAANLLKSKQYNVSEVASLTGFSSITIFSRAFKDFYGMPPTAYTGKQDKEPADHTE